MEHHLDSNDFRLWMDDKVTKAFFETIKEMCASATEQRLNKKYIQSNEGLLKLNYFLGYSDALSDILDITIEDEDESDETN